MASVLISIKIKLLFIIWYIQTENYTTVDTSHITVRLCNQYYWFNNTSGKGLESRLFQFGSYLVALDIEKDSDNSRAGQRIHIVCLIFENEEGRNKTGFYYSVCVFSRICERVSCVESVIFFLNLANIPHIKQNNSILLLQPKNGILLP